MDAEGAHEVAVGAEGEADGGERDAEVALAGGRRLERAARDLLAARHQHRCTEVGGDGERDAGAEAGHVLVGQAGVGAAAQLDCPLLGLGRAALLRQAALPRLAHRVAGCAADGAEGAGGRAVVGVVAAQPVDDQRPRLGRLQGGQQRRCARGHRHQRPRGAIPQRPT